MEIPFGKTHIPSMYLFRCRSFQNRRRITAAVLEDISAGFGKHKYCEPVNVPANYSSRYKYRISTAGTIEHTIANKGVVIYGG
jgi:hypothetical protein